MTTSRLIASLIVASALVASQAVLAQAPALSAKLEASRVVTAVDGKVVRSAADQAKPGDVVEYSATYANAGATTINDVLAVIPVPAGTTLVAGSAAPAGVQATLDGKTFATVPLKRTVKQADGKAHEELIPVSEYRALRWDITSLPSKKDALVSLRVQVNPPVVTASATAVTGTPNSVAPLK